MTYWRKKPIEKKELELLKHLKALNLSSISEYIKWCKENGFSSGVNKSNNQRDKEIVFFNEKKFNEKELESKKGKINYKKFDELNFDLLLKSFKKHDGKILAINKEDREPFFKFYTFLEKKTKIIKNIDIDVIYNIFSYKHAWIKDFEEIAFKSKNPERQFHELLMGLFSRYKIPILWDKLWLEKDENYVRWFLDLSYGKNLRFCANLPFSLTKKQAHEALNAPINLSPLQALRYGQVKGLGGDERTAMSFVNSFLGRRNDRHIRSSKEEYEKFWQTVILFVIQNPMLDRNQVGPLLDFLREEKFSLNAPRPGLTMAGRNPMNLLLEMEQWHSEVNKTTSKDVSWNSAGITGFYKEEKSKNEIRAWQIIEILNSKELKAEGKAQSHCVGSYVKSCEKGSSSIYSLRLLEPRGGSFERFVTIEVIPQTRTIVQIRGKYNSKPNIKTIEIINEWAGKERLNILPGIRY